MKKYIYHLVSHLGTSAVVRWLRFCAATAGDAGLIFHWGTKIPYASWYGQKKKKKDNYIKKKKKSFK